MNRHTLLFTGGLDSIISYYYLTSRLIDPVKLVYYKIGHRYQQAEIDSIYRFMDISKVDVDIRGDGPYLGGYEKEDGWIPARNLFLSSLASCFSDIIYLVVQKGEDCTEDRNGEFFLLVSYLLTKLHHRHIKLDPVFPLWTKQDMVKWYIGRGHDPMLLLNAYSCFSGDGPCSACPACFRKFISLEFSGLDTSLVIDKTKLFSWDGLRDYITKLNSGYYDAVRTMQTKAVLHKYNIM